MVRELARQRNITQGEAASLLILNGGAGHKAFKKRNGGLLARNDGVPITREEVNAALYGEWPAVLDTNGSSRRPYFGSFMRRISLAKLTKLPVPGSSLAAVSTSKSASS